MLALLASISAVLTLLFFHNEWSAISSNNQRKNSQILLAMSEVCKEIHDTPGKTSAYKYFKTFLKTPEIIEVSCRDSRDRVFMEDKYYNPYPHQFSPFFRPFTPPKIGVWGIKTDTGVETLEASLKVKSAKGGEIISSVIFSTQLIYQEMDSSLSQASASFFIILSIAFAIGCIGILIITRLIVAPIQTMAEAARMIGSGRLDYRIPVISGDEMGMLASEFNNMSDRLKGFDDMKRDFASSITHDLRSPVTGIELCADMIKELAGKREYNKIPEQVFSICEHSQRLNRFIDSMLEISRIESGEMTLNLRTVNLEELVDRAVRSFKTYAIQKGIKFELVIGQDIPDILGDPDRLYQVLANIIGNAVKFTGSGSVSVYTQTEPGWQKVRVCDTGVGIPRSELGNIFSKFYRINSDRQGYPSARQGTGLGLFIAKSIIEQHGGRIEVESTPGKGSVFTIVLPARR
jgi:signal transduction histidine kinase